MRTFLALMKSFRKDRRGNIAVIFAIACIPVLSAIGCGVDYSEASRMRAKLQSAADAAAVASISQNSQGWLAASQMSGNGAVTTAQTDAMNIFLGNINNVYNPGNPSPSANLFTLNTPPTAAVVTKTGANLTSTVTFNATVPTIFMNVVGFKSLTVAGSSSASSSLPLYLDFYLMLDVSGSMGLPSTTSEANRMQSINPDNKVQYPTGCTIACHFAQPPLNNLKSSACIDPAPNKPANSGSTTQQYPTGNYCLGYDISRVSQNAYAKLLANHGGQLPSYKYTSINSPQVAQPTAFYSVSPSFPNDPVLTPVTSCPTPGTDACIQLRLDAVGYAVNQLLVTANKVAVVSQQFRVGLYPYINSMDKFYSTLTSTLNGDPNTPGTINYAAANLATLLDTNTNSSLGSGGTNQDAALSTMNTVITTVGNGSAPSNTLPYVFMVTDGAVTPQTKGVPNGSWSGSNHDTVIATPDTNCTALKNRGIKVSILYIPFQPISPVNASFAGDEDDYANNNIPHIPPSLQACASPPDSSGSYFYTANTPADINSALQAMFNHALTTAHLTN